MTKKQAKVLVSVKRTGAYRLLINSFWPKQNFRFEKKGSAILQAILGFYGQSPVLTFSLKSRPLSHSSSLRSRELLSGKPLLQFKRLAKGRQLKQQREPLHPHSDKGSDGSTIEKPCTEPVSLEKVIQSVKVKGNLEPFMLYGQVHILNGIQTNCFSFLVLQVLLIIIEGKDANSANKGRCLIRQARICLLLKISMWNQSRVKIVSSPL